MKRSWLAIVGELASRDLARSGWRHLRVAADDRPVPGERVAVLRTHRPDYATRARVIGTAEVREASSDGLMLRHRFVAPEGHEPSPREIAHLHASVAWTDARVEALVGSVRPIGAEDFARIERVVRERALAFGPPAKRPQHRRPRTPGRRAILSARVMSRSLPSFR